MATTLHISNTEVATLNAAKVVARLSGKDFSVQHEETNQPAYITHEGQASHGYSSIFAHITGVDSPLLGTTETEKKDVTDWLNQFSIQTLPLFLSNDQKLISTLHKINKSLLISVFFVSNHLTLADLVFYAAVHPLVEKWTEKERITFLNITRWFDNVQHLPELATSPLFLIPIVQDVPEQVAKEGKDQAEKGGKETGKEKENTKGKENAETKSKKGKEVALEPPKTSENPSPTTITTTETPKITPASDQKDQKNVSNESNKGKQQQGPKKEQPAGKGKGGAPAPKEAAPALSPNEDVSRFDIRVARIVTCKKHEAADSLYVEQIDVGEPEPRQVVSGLVKFIPLEEMQNRRVVILANLKPTNLKGVRSQAMVLCASNEDHTKVELVEPPEGAKVGERVSFEGFPGDPEKVLAKKETIDKILADLKSTEDLVATYKGVPFMTSAGPCVVKSIANGGIK